MLLKRCLQLNRFVASSCYKVSNFSRCIINRIWNWINFERWIDWIFWWIHWGESTKYSSSQPTSACLSCLLINIIEVKLCLHDVSFEFICTILNKSIQNTSYWRKSLKNSPLEPLKHLRQGKHRILHLFWIWKWYWSGCKIFLHHNC